MITRSMSYGRSDSTEIAMHPDLGFSYRTSARGEVRIFRAGREVTVLRNQAASRFLGRAEGATPEALQ